MSTTCLINITYLLTYLLTYLIRRTPLVDFGQLDGLCFLVAYQLNSLFIFMMLLLFNVQLRNKYDDDDVVPRLDLRQT